MRIRHLLLTLILILATGLIGCSTNYTPFESKGKIFEGRGGTREIVDGMEIWSNGEPPERFKILGIIDDERGAGIIPMSQLKTSIVAKAREAGGDAVIALGSDSKITGYTSTGTATAYGTGYGATAYGSGISVAHRRNYARFAVIAFARPGESRPVVPRAAAPATPAYAAVPATAPSTTASSRPPATVRAALDQKIVAETATTLTFSWILELTNARTQAADISPRLQFLDLDGFVIHQIELANLTLAAGGNSIQRGLHELPRELGERVHRLGCELSIAWR